MRLATQKCIWGQETYPIRVNAWYEMNWANSFFKKFQKPHFRPNICPPVKHEARNTKMNRGQETHPTRVNARYEINWANSFFKKFRKPCLQTDVRTDGRKDRHWGESSIPSFHLRWSGGIKIMILNIVFGIWLKISCVTWPKSPWNATYCIDFTIITRILNTPVSAKMAQGQRKWYAANITYCNWLRPIDPNSVPFDHTWLSWGSIGHRRQTYPVHNLKNTNCYECQFREELRKCILKSPKSLTGRIDAFQLYHHGTLFSYYHHDQDFPRSGGWASYHLYIRAPS